GRGPHQTVRPLSCVAPPPPSPPPVWRGELPYCACVSLALHHSLSMIGGNGRLVVSQVAQDVVSVLAEHRRGGTDAPGGLREFERAIGESEMTGLGMLDSDGHLPVLDVRIVEHLIVAIHRPTGNASRYQQVMPCGTGLVHQRGFHGCL